MSDSWKKVGGFSRTGTQNFVRNSDAAMGGTIFGSSDISRNSISTIMKIGDNAGVMYINGDIDMSGGSGQNAPINRIKNVRDPISGQDVATKHYVDDVVNALVIDAARGFTGTTGPHGIGFAGQDGRQGETGPTGITGPIGPPGSVIGVKGEKGDKGDAGATGSTGAQGPTGPQGPIGLKGDIGLPGSQGIQGSNGTILWLNTEGKYVEDENITDSYLLSTTPIESGMKIVGPISVSATYGNSNYIQDAARFWNKTSGISDLTVIPSGVWTINLYANVPVNSDTNQLSIYAALFMITGTSNQPSPDSLITETGEGDTTFLPPRDTFLPSHIKYIGKSWSSSLSSNTLDASSGVIIDSTVRKRYAIPLPVEFITLRDSLGNTNNVYIQLQIYLKNTKASNQSASANLYFQSDFDSNNTTYSYLQTTLGAIGERGIPGSVGPTGYTGSTGSKGENGIKGDQGIRGQSGPTGAEGPTGPRGPTGPTGPRGLANSKGPQYTVQYRNDPFVSDASGGDFSGNENFRYLPPAITGIRGVDPSFGTVSIKDISCSSIHSPFYVTNELFTDSAVITPRTFFSGGDDSLPFLATGFNPAPANQPRSIPTNSANISNGVNMRYNTSSGQFSINMKYGNTAEPGIAGLKIDAAANLYAGTENFVVSAETGRVGIGGVTINEINSNTELGRKLHVKGTVMVGDSPGSAASADANIMLNGPKPAPLSRIYPGIYHRSVTGTTASTLNLPTSYGLGITSSDWITFQTGGASQSNSMVIDGAGIVSVVGRTNLNGPVCIGKNFVNVASHGSVTPQLDISGSVNITTTTNSLDIDKPRIKLISNAVATNLSIPAITGQSTNEITGVGQSSGGFLRLSAENSSKSSIELIGENTSSSIGYSNSIRFATSGLERMLINASGTVDVTGNTILRNSVRIGSSVAPSVALDVTGAAKVSSSLEVSGAAKVSTLLSAQTGLILGDNTKTAMDNGEDPSTGLLLNIINTGGDKKPRLRFVGEQNSFDIGCSNYESFIWSKGDKSLGIATKNLRRITITNTGNVGIGIESATSLLHVAGAAKITGNLDMSSTGKIVNLVTPTTAADAATKAYVDGAIPIGGIIMWSGSIAAIPSNWKLCNGQNSTPDLRNRFVIGAIVDSGTTAATNITGNDTQTGGTKDAVVVQHNHTATSGYNSARAERQFTLADTSDGGNYHRLRVGGWSYYTTESMDADHTHPITVDQQGVSGTNQNLPPYYALAFIMRVS